MSPELMRKTRDKRYRDQVIHSLTSYAKNPTLERLPYSKATIVQGRRLPGNKTLDQRGQVIGEMIQDGTIRVHPLPTEIQAFIHVPEGHLLPEVVYLLSTTDPYSVWLTLVKEIHE